MPKRAAAEAALEQCAPPAKSPRQTAPSPAMPKSNIPGSTRDTLHSEKNQPTAGRHPTVQNHQDETAQPTPDSPISRDNDAPPSPSPSSSTAEDNVIIDLRSTPKPAIRLPANFLHDARDLRSRLTSLLPQLEHANHVLETGDARVNLEDVDEDDQHIEMNLGLGVLEERRDGDGSESEDSGSESSDGSESESESGSDDDVEEQGVEGLYVAGRKGRDELECDARSKAVRSLLTAKSSGRNGPSPAKRDFIEPVNERRYSEVPS